MDLQKIKGRFRIIERVFCCYVEKMRFNRKVVRVSNLVLTRDNG